MKALSKIAAGVSPSATLAVSALAKKMKAEGKDVIGFGAGEPDFATPDRISYAGVRAICDGKTRYTPAAGMIELRQAICDRTKADYGLEYEATQAVVASGAKHMVYIALAALVDPGDEVIVPAPYWVSYYEMVRLFGGVPVVVNVSEEQGFQLTPEQLEQAITDKTKAIILNNPSNPTGAVYPKEALKLLPMSASSMTCISSRMRSMISSSMTACRSPASPRSVTRSRHTRSSSTVSPRPMP